MKKLLLILLLLPSISIADVSLGIGLGKGIIKNQFGAHEVFERAIKLGYIKSGDTGAYVRPEIGGYLAHGAGRCSSFFGSLIIGAAVLTPVGMYGYMGIGPTYLTKPDGVALTGHFQFNVQGGLCMQGKTSIRICFEYSHLSNAGVMTPNRGIDLIGVGVHFK